MLDPTHIGASENIPCTFFEYTTMLAICHFAAQDVDVAVMEVGLGGRLDSTNSLSPIATAVTSIGLDHTGVLGDTLELIAGEKAGIIKPGVPIVLGPHAVPRPVFLQEAADVGASAVVEIPAVPIVENSLYPRPGSALMISNYESENNQIASAILRAICTDGGSSRSSSSDLFAARALRVKKTLVASGIHEEDIGAAESDTADPVPSAVAEAIEQACPPCRFEQFTLPVSWSGFDENNDMYASQQDVEVVLDVAHNPPALEALVNRVRSTYPGRPVRVVVGLSASKDLGNGLRPLLDLCTIDGREEGKQLRLHLVQADHPRAAAVHELAAVVEAIVGGTAEEIGLHVHPEGRASKGVTSSTAQTPSMTDGSRTGMPGGAGTLKSMWSGYPLRPSFVRAGVRDGVLCPQSVRDGVLGALHEAAMFDSKLRDVDSDAREIVLICGTVFIMSDVREAIGLHEPRDSPYVQEVHGAHLNQDNARISAAESLAAARAASKASGK
jgi:folylpolyglutamate synthase/dihydropteroate synthase